MSAGAALNRYVHGRVRFFRTAVLLVRAGKVHEPDIACDQTPSVDRAAIDSLPDTDLQVLLDEGRRHMDASNAQLESIRARAQVLFSFGILLLGASAALLVPLRTHSSELKWALWVLAVIANLLGVSAAGAIHSVGVRAEQIHPAVLLRGERPFLKRLAAEYADIATASNRVNITLLNVYRDAVASTALGSLLSLLLWLWIQFRT